MRATKRARTTGECVSGGDPRKIGEGYDVTADPSGKFLYLMRTDANGYVLLRMPAGGGDAENRNLCSIYAAGRLKMYLKASN